MEELLKNLGIEESAVNAMDTELASKGISDSPIRVEWKKGMKFNLSAIEVNIYEDRKTKEKGDPFPMYACSNGGKISPKHFQDVKNDPYPLSDFSRKGMIRYFLAHQKGNTEFRIKDYTKSSGVYNTDDYVPTSFKIEVISTDIVVPEGEE